jgi:hypothetical protein
VMSVAVLAGCGQGTTTNTTPPTTTTATSTTATTATPTTGTAVTTTTASTASTTPPASYYFKLTGPNGTYTTPAVITDSILKVTVTSGAPTPINGSGGTAGYTCLQYNVTVGSDTQQVMVSYGNPSYGSVCYGIPNSQTLDFSSQLTSGTHSLTATISAPLYDNCRLYGGYYFYYGGCSMTAVYSTHSVSGVVQVHMNGTQ